MPPAPSWSRSNSPRSGKRNIVICDRYADSTTAYQGYGRGLDLAMVTAVNRIATQGLTPDLTILLDVPVGGRAGPEEEHKGRTVFRRRTVNFHRRVREGYLKLAKAEPKRWLVIDATKSKDEIAGIIWQRVSKLLPKIRDGFP